MSSLPDTAASRYRRSLLWLGRGLAAALLCLIALSGAQAQAPGSPPGPPPPLSDIEITATPYLWFPWISVGIRPADTRIRDRSETIDPGNLYGHLTWVPFMGSAEFRDGPYALSIDYIHAPLKAGIGTRDILFSGATSGLDINIGTAMFLYRPIALPDQYVDVGLGVRAWGLGGDIALNQGLLPAANVSNGLAWADPMLTARYHRDLGNGYSMTASGDIGGFGLGAHLDWQLVGTIDYAVNSCIELRGGFRTLNVNYGGSRADFNINMYGPILGATFRF